MQVSAQKNPDHSCDVPLVVTRFVPSSGTVELVQDLTAKDLTVKVGGTSRTVENASIDRGGKRIGLILDASKNIPQDEWKLETKMAVSLMEHARPEDKIALSLIGVDIPAGSFLAASGVRARLQALASSRPKAPDDSERIYDALLLAAQHLDPPEFGDSIFLFGHPDDSGSKANPEQVQELILRNRLRFYGMSFTDPLGIAGGLLTLVNGFLTFVAPLLGWGRPPAFAEYLFFATIETVATSVIIWQAWTWSGVEAEVSTERSVRQPEAGIISS